MVDRVKFDKLIADEALISWARMARETYSEGYAMPLSYLDKMMVRSGVAYALRFRPDIEELDEKTQAAVIERLLSEVGLSY